jgi:hypothetical protein
MSNRNRLTHKQTINYVTEYMMSLQKFSQKEVARRVMSRRLGHAMTKGNACSENRAN